MPPFSIEKTKRTPKIIFDPETKIFEMSGRSVPEDPKSFYQSVLEWVDHYVANPLDKLTVNICLEYFNTSSSKVLYTIFKKFESMPKAPEIVEINWYFEEGDLDLLEAGEDFGSLLKIPFNLIEMPE